MKVRHLKLAAVASIVMFLAAGSTALLVEFLRVRADTAASCRFTLCTTVRYRLADNSECLAVVTGTRIPDGLLWREQIVVAPQEWRRMAPTIVKEDEVLFNMPQPVPARDVTSLQEGISGTIQGRVVRTEVTLSDMTAALAAGGTLVRPCPHATGLIARGATGAAGLTLLTAGLCAAGWRLTRSQLRARRLRAGLCARCCYPFSQGRCPECGSEAYRP